MAKSIEPFAEYSVCEPCIIALDTGSLASDDGIVPLSRVAADHVLIAGETRIGFVEEYECEACGREVSGNVYYDVIEYEVKEIGK